MCFDRPVTVVALKRLGAGVFAVVPRQLVAPGESPLAALPRALVRLLTWGMKGKKNTHEHLFYLRARQIKKTHVESKYPSPPR